ncbi:MAG TPA: chromosome segregation protein SMC [Verrucomicrobiales bacterium]|nr:chromosome segregation protein SMC [Verrucomicrobiales bacterium]
MFLKNLTLFGFKSFAEKTYLDFRQGVTAIVGPNGCGKSNVSDAIRWVLGEQSAKALRGGEMADVIFNGTDRRKPLAMAEVELTIGDVDEDHLKAAGVEISYNEVTITRRIYRDGGSEYLFNRSTCRLKDIQQFFMGTGIGRTSYSIMAQGNITQILSSRPDDRRLIFEEAAGITKFKSQKREALRKLDYTDQNLLRVADTVKEVKRQLGSLQRQANKALRYREIRDELMFLEIQQTRWKHKRLQVQYGEQEQQIESTRLQIEQGKMTLQTAEEQQKTQRSREIELASELNQLRQSAHNFNTQLNRHQSQIQFNKERQEELARLDVQANQDIASADRRNASAIADVEAVQKSLEESGSDLELRRKDLAGKAERLQRLVEELQRVRNRQDESTNDAFEVSQKLARIRNGMNGLAGEQKGNLTRLEKLKIEKTQLIEGRELTDKKLQIFAGEVDTQKETLREVRQRLAEQQNQLKASSSGLEIANREYEDNQQEQAEKKSRFAVLMQLNQEHEGVSAGTVAALESSVQSVGIIADLIKVPDSYVVAIEAALGHHLQMILTEHPDVALELLSDAAVNGKGRISVAPIAVKKRIHEIVRIRLGQGKAADGDKDSGETDQTEAERSTSGEGGVLDIAVRAATVVDSDWRVEPLIQGLLNRTLIVPDLRSAMEAWEQSGGQFEFVTLKGELLNREGVFVGGEGDGEDHEKLSSSLLRRGNQIQELKVGITQLEDRAGQLSEKRTLLREEVLTLRRQVGESEALWRSREVSIAAREGEFNAMQESQRSMLRKIETVDYEIENLEDHRDRNEDQITELHQQKEECEKNEREMKESLENIRQEFDQINRLKESMGAEQMEAKVAFAAQEQIAVSLENRLTPLRERVRETKQMAEQRNLDIEDYQKRRTQYIQEISESEQSVVQIQQENENLLKLQSDVCQGREELGETILAVEQSLKQNRDQLSTLQETSGMVEVQWTKTRMEMEQQVERIRQKYQQEITEVEPEGVRVISEEGKLFQYEKVDWEEFQENEEQTAWPAVNEQVIQLQKKLDMMGVVNMVAIEEYEETEQRCQFLVDQYDDLVLSKQQLLEVIDKINVQTREMFLETFSAIRKNFAELFAEIFGGGRADLQLVDEEDVLESGIDIVARPPGKQLQSISLLSGGEQTMTAVSLLFAIYQVKPSPFCVLDELDAPLDESNIGRFVRILQRFLDRSQFIIITHSKRTISMADVLYGVTMQERGISKIVSVNFQKQDSEKEGKSASHENDLVPEESKTAVQMENKKAVLSDSTTPQTAKEENLTVTE